MADKKGNPMKKKEKKNEQRKSTWNNTLFILKSIKEYDRHLLGLVAVNALFSALGQFVPVFAPKYIIDELTGGGSVRSVIIIVIISGLVAFVSDSISKTSANSIFNRFIMVRLHLIARSGRKFMTTDFQSLENPDVLDLSKRGDRACLNNQDGVEGVMHRLRSIFDRSIVLIGCGAVITALHPLMLLFISLLILINFLVSSRTRMLDKKINDALAKVRRKLDYLKDVMADFSYAKEIRLFGMKDFIAGRYGHEQKEYFAGSMKIQAIWLKAKNLFALTGLVEEAMLYPEFRTHQSSAELKQG